MENVKGMLSSTVESRLVFEKLMEDLSSLGTGRSHRYELRAIRVKDGKATLLEAEKPADFIVRSEEFGVPQKRHRVIIIGIRSDLADRASRAKVAVAGNSRTVGRTIRTLPALRSGISRGGDDVSAWRHEVVQAAELLAEITEGTEDSLLYEALASLRGRLEAEMPSIRKSSTLPDQYGVSNDELRMRRPRTINFSLAGALCGASS